MLPPGPMDSSSQGAMGGVYPLASSRPALTGLTTSTDAYGYFWTKLQFGCTIDAKIWPSPTLTKSIYFQT